MNLGNSGLVSGENDPCHCHVSVICNAPSTNSPLLPFTPIEGEERTICTQFEQGKERGTEREKIERKSERENSRVRSHHHIVE